MATKAERFRSAAERSSPGRPKKEKPVKRTYGVDTAKPGVSVTDRRAGGTSTGLRNVSLGKKASFAFEDSLAPARPSRKSGRRSANRQKAGTTLATTQLLTKDAPKSRHDRAAVSNGRVTKAASRPVTNVSKVTTKSGPRPVAKKTAARPQAKKTARPRAKG